MLPLGPGPEFDRVRAIARALGPLAASLGDDCAILPEVSVATHHRRSLRVRCVPIVAPTIECHLMLSTASKGCRAR